MKPTLEEIAEYVKEQGLQAKVSPTRFYDYYNKQDFLYRGLPMDWKAKVQEWAKTQKGSVPTSAADYKLYQKAVPQISLEELRRRIAMI